MSQYQEHYSFCHWISVVGGSASANTINYYVVCEKNSIVDTFYLSKHWKHCTKNRYGFRPRYSPRFPVSKVPCEISEKFWVQNLLRVKPNLKCKFSSFSIINAMFSFSSIWSYFTSSLTCTYLYAAITNAISISNQWLIGINPNISIPVLTSPSLLDSGSLSSQFSEKKLVGPDKKGPWTSNTYGNSNSAW